jgi:hypothetical protein
VYNYSTFGYEGGVTVVIEGDSWQVETVSDSNGYYRIGNLGVGSGEVNLRLPPGTHPVVFDWPVRLYDKADLQVDLGFYWGDNPPIPLLLSGNLEDNILTVQVENRTSETSTGGVIEIETPASIRVPPTVEVIEGNVVEVDYDPHQLRIGVGELLAEAKTTVNVSLTEVASRIGDDQPVPSIRVMFTYDQQHTPQLIEIAPDEFIQALALTQSDAPAQQNSAAPSSAPSTQSGLSAELTLPTSTPSSGSTPSAAQATPTPLAEGTSPPQTTEPTPLPQLPITGGKVDTNETAKLSFSILIVLSLTMAGWWSLKVKSS